MPLSSPSAFHSDGPITRATEDRLGRTKFAEGIGEGLISWSQPESLVTAIYGNWGSGKSSVKNLILEHIRKRKLLDSNLKFEVTEFNPWQFSGSEQLCHHFFTSLAETISKLPVDSCSKEAALKKESAKRLRGYGKALSWGGTIFDAATLVMTAHLPPAAAITKAASTALKSLSNWIKGETTDDKNLSMQSLKDQLRSDFISLGYKHLVIIDDVDRLTPDEVCLLFRLVKANSDFPNLTFLLLAQRSSAVKALHEITQGEGDRFLEKIIQVPFDLPLPSSNEVDKVLDDGIRSILVPLLNPDEWDEDRYSEIWHEMLGGLFLNLRSTYRFLNTLAFTASFFKGETAYEVNAIDLLALEALRVLEPDVYNLLAINKRTLLGDFGHGRDSESTNDAVAILYKTLYEASVKKQNVERGLRKLFPSIEFIISKTAYSSEHWSSTWKRQQRVCDDECFDRYFMLTVPSTQVSESEIRRFLSASRDRQLMKELLLAWDARGILRNALIRIETEDFSKKIESPREFIAALLEVFEEREKVSELWPFNEPERAVGIWSRELLLKEPDQKKRDQLAIDFVQDSDTLFSSLRMASYFIPMNTEDKDRKIVSDHAVQTIRSMLRDRISSHSESLLSHPQLSFIFWSWMRLDEAQAKAWMKSKIENPLQFTRALAALTFEVSSSTGHRTKKFQVIRADSLERIAPLGDWQRYAATSRPLATAA